MRLFSLPPSPLFAFFLEELLLLERLRFRDVLLLDPLFFVEPRFLLELLRFLLERLRFLEELGRLEPWPCLEPLRRCLEPSFLFLDGEADP